VIKASIPSFLSSPSYTDAFSHSKFSWAISPTQLPSCLLYTRISSSCSSFCRLIAAGPQKLSSRSLRIRYLTLVANIIASYTTPTRQATACHLRFYPSTPKAEIVAQENSLSPHNPLPPPSVLHHHRILLSLAFYWFRLWSLQSLSFSCEYNCMPRILDI
jgi:hypothetical protein